MSIIFSSKNYYLNSLGWKYSDLKQGAVWVKDRSEPVKVELITLAANDRAHWQAATSSKKDVDCRIYEVTIQENEDFDTAVEHLKYFFIRADRAYAQTKLQYGLLVRTAGTNLFRLRVWLSMLATEGSRYNLLYCVPGDRADRATVCYPIDPASYNSKKHRMSVGRIMPLMRIIASENKQYAGDINISALYSTEQYPQGAKLSTDEIKECCEKDYTAWEFYCWNSLRELCKIFLIRMVKNIKGSADNKMSKEEKADLRKELSSFICGKRENMTLLGELCWFYNLQYLMEEKLLLHQNNTLNHIALRQSYLDVITYTDGVLQLLENSCQHSQLKTAYLYIRTHYVARTGTDRQLSKSVQKRSELVNRYQALSGTQWELDPIVKSYLEISVTDDAYVSKSKRKGIWETYCDNAKQRYPGKNLMLPETLKDIFEDTASAVFTSDEEIVHHYGIPALQQMIIKNHGVFLVSSPSPKGTEIVKISKTKKEFVTREQLHAKKKIAPPSLDETSEYHILFPLGLADQQLDTTTNSNWKPLFDVQNMGKPVATRVFGLPKDIEKLAANVAFLEQKEKIFCVDRACAAFYKEQATIDDMENCIQLFDVRGINSLQLELFAKFLFQVILKSQNQRRLYAVFFDDHLKQQEFIRLFGIFVGRKKARLADGQSPLHAQIALCSEHTALHVPEVNLILNAQNWDSLLESARRFAYCNWESAQEIYAEVKYLPYEGKGNSSAEPMFPFDLYLHETMQPEDTSGDASKTSLCWFLQRIAALLQRDMQQVLFGIKIQDIHAYLQSNIHLQSFYAAEQLFHNAAYVSRFAYLMAQRLIRSKYVGQNYLIVCYEAYSSLLGQYLADYLRTFLGDDTTAEYALMYQEQKGRRQLVMPPRLREKEYAKDFYQNCKFICLLPIGTTLSTIHVMHDCLVKDTQVQITAGNMRNLVLLLVAESNPQSLHKRYWHEIPEDSFRNYSLCGGCVKLHGRYNESEWNVDFFLKEEAVWHNPEDCAQYENERTFVHPDASAIELNMVFPIKKTLDFVPQSADAWNLFHQHDVCSLIGFSMEDINTQRVKMLKNCMRYGHIMKGCNHFEYLIDLPRYYDVIRNPDLPKGSGYADWINDMRKLGIAKDAFNIIVSPLRNGRSPLLKDVLDKVFEHSAHILQLDLQKARRTDIRTKYSYITEECKQLIRNNPLADIRFYYVDDAIVSAETLRRGRSMIQLLLGEYIPMGAKNALYSGVFVLVNRSSRDTVKTFVKNPDTDFHAFVHLAIPHFNTRGNYCPACQRIERYQQMILRSTTNRFSEEYQRLSEKHKLRNIEEYDRWQKENLFENPGAFHRLRQWIYHAKDIQSEDIQTVKDELKRIKREFIQRFIRCHTEAERGKEESLAAMLQRPELQQEFLEALEQQTLGCCLPDAKNDKKNTVKNAFENVWTEHILPEKAYRRAISAHNAYCMLPLEIEPVYKSGTGKIPNEDMFDRVIQYLTPDETCDTDVEKWEYILSGIKVVSRDFLARHHLLRETIFDVLHYIADILQGKILDNKKIMNLLTFAGNTKEIPSLDYQKEHPIDPLLRYQMFHSVLRRLSEMESNYAILSLSQGLLLSELNQLTKAFFRQSADEQTDIDRWFYCTIPSYERMVFDYGKCIKLATMAEDEENKSMLIQKEYRHFSNREASGGKE